MLGRLKKELDYEEEHFGILTDDDLYLDCVLVKPRNAKDEDLKVIRAWVPCHPLTKTSVIVCARQEVLSYGPDGKIAHLVFDLRGTGESEGGPTDTDYDIDLKSVKAWADERFGDKISFGFLGTPYIANGRVSMLPIRPSVVMETYYYPPLTSNHTRVLYLSSYGNFDRLDDARCAALAAAGYEVYGLDPMRYLLHASVSGLIKPEDLRQDLLEVIQLIEGDPYLIGMSLSAGLAVLWGGLVDKVKGVTAIGYIQNGFRPKHIFDLSQPLNYSVARYITRISPRPLALVYHEGHSLAGDKQELATLFKSAVEPRRLERATDITPKFLLDLLEWQQRGGK